jgi:amphi-Trp domain-containing protein
MSDRDVESEVDRARFVETLRRLADAIENGEAFRIQVANRRFVVPTTATLQIEHEVEGNREELALELTWNRAGGEP